eukprot:1912609-Prymnesium_polylepis.2
MLDSVVKQQRRARVEGVDGRRSLNVKVEMGSGDKLRRPVGMGEWHERNEDVDGVHRRGEGRHGRDAAVTLLASRGGGAGALCRLAAATNVRPVRVPRLRGGAGEGEHAAEVREGGISAEQRVHESHPRRVVREKGEGIARQLGQLEVVAAGRAHLDLEEAAVDQLLLQIERLDRVHVVCITALHHLGRCRHLLRVDAIGEHAESVAVQLFHKREQVGIRWPLARERGPLLARHLCRRLRCRMARKNRRPIEGVVGGSCRQ